MKKHLLAVVSRLAFCSIVLTAVALFGVTALAQSQRKQPEAILVYEMGKPNRKTAVKPAVRNAPSRARVVNEAEESFDSIRPTAVEQEAFRLINAERRRRGIAPLVWDAGMLYVARKHSQDMARRGYFSHTSRDGRTVEERADEAGINDWNSIGENIAYSLGAHDGMELAVESWLKSPRHRDNLLNKEWKRSGIGVAVNNDGKVYVTQVFRD